MLLRNNPRFAALTAAQMLSSLGNWLMILAVMVLIGIRWHHGPFAVALGVVVLVAPGMVVQPMAGLLADRRPRKGIMLTANLLSAVAALSVLVVRDLWQLYVALALLGSFDAFFSPAESGMIKELVADSDMPGAMSLRMAVSQGTKILGPSLSGMLVATFGARVPFAIDAGCFVASAAIITFIPGGRAHLAHRVGPREPAHYGDGFRYLLTSRPLRTILGFFAIVLFVVQMVDSQFVILLRGIPNAARLLGITMSASGLGMVITALLMGRASIRRPMVWIAVGSLTLGVGFGGAAILVLIRLFWAVPILMLGTAAAAALAIIPFQTVMQRDTPVDWTGRVMAAVGVITSACVVAGPLVGGLAVSNFGVIPAFLLVGLLLILVSGIGGVITWGQGRVHHAESESDLQRGQTGTTHRGR